MTATETGGLVVAGDPRPSVVGEHQRALEEPRVLRQQADPRVGAVGLALDRWLGTNFLALVGLLLGLGVAIYLVVMKYAPPVPPAGKGARKTTPGGRRSRPRTQKGQR